jgi:hypothetical protein
MVFSARVVKSLVGATSVRYVMKPKATVEKGERSTTPWMSWPKST